MSKLKNSIAVLRQIPEHIRNNYPLFVEFLKMYYQYLEETQQQDLEGLHDIDTVTDEFIDRFKGELAKNFPIHLATDKRLVLKHLREFYLSRGSEASYKFLFRTLFGKEASLYYPSRQILRASDGRWTQDVSIFVQPTGAIPNITEIVGKFILITNNRGKIVRSFIKNVVKYSEEIYEIFIERDYVNEINVGATVTYENTTYSGVVLPCPTSIKVYKGGKGFSVGDIYVLKTQLGRGCVIKITKVDSQGSIQRVQVIRFGLDYETKFYSYLSNKENTGIEYIHPLKIGAGTSDNQIYTVTTAGTNTYNVNYITETGTPLVLVEVIRNGALVKPTPSYTALTGTSVTINDLQIGDTVSLYGILTKGVVPGAANPAYNELSGGFVDYGWASKQTYFYYDTDVPVGDESWASDRYFADPAYVGDIVQQFYNDASLKVVDEDLAIIEIDLGAVAKYPGYYSTADGFVSDEIYIQDGFYYQAFSYVIRVEEELRRYADIIKALVHPAGMKVFSEYNIYNELKLSSTQPKSFLSLTLPLYDHAPSSVILDERGYEFDSYDSQLVGGEVVLTPSAGANPVLNKQGRPSFHVVKKLLDAATSVDNVDNKHVYKLITDALTERFTSVVSSDPSWTIVRSYDETISKNFGKNVSSSITQYIEALAKHASKEISDIISEPETRDFSIEKPLTDSAGQIEAISKLVEKPFADSLTEYLVTVVKTFFKNIDETIVETETLALAIEKLIIDLQIIDEQVAKLVEKQFADSLTEYTETFVKTFFKNVNDSITESESLAFIVEKTISDTQVITEELGKGFSRTLTDSIPDLYSSVVSSDPTWSIVRNYDETISKLLDKTAFDSLSAPTDSVDILRLKYIEETLGQSETYYTSLNRLFEEIAAPIENVSNELIRTYSETIALEDVAVVSRGILVYFIETITNSETYISAFNKNIDLTQFVADLSTAATNKAISDAQAVLDEQSKLLEKPFADSQSSTDDDVYLSSKNPNETINTTMTGNLVLNPYNAEVYFVEITNTYQPSTSLT